MREDAFPFSIFLPHILLFSPPLPYFFFVVVPFFLFSDPTPPTIYKACYLEDGVKRAPLTRAKMLGHKTR